MGRVLSYYKREGDKVIEEYLSEHIKACINLLSKFNGSKIERTGTFLNKNFFDSVRLSIIFHDLGKVFYWRREGEDTIYFTGHEVFSAYILRKFEKDLKRKKLDELEEISKILKPALFAVAFHHHPMSIEERLKKINERMKWIRFTPTCLDDLKHELSYLDNILNTEEKMLLNNVLDNIKRSIEERQLRIEDVKQGFHDIDKEIFQYFISKSDTDVALKKLSYLTLTALVCVDYISASEIRGGKTRFSDVVEDFYRFYMKEELPKILKK